MTGRARSTQFIPSAARLRPPVGAPALLVTVVALAVLSVRFFRQPPEGDAGLPPAKTVPPAPRVDSDAGRSDRKEPAGEPSIDFARDAATALTAAPEQCRAELNAVYFEWGRREPESAVQSALHIPVSELRAYAVDSALSGWSHAAPGQLAETALAFPEGREKQAALTKAIRAWLVDEPEKAGAWIAAHPATMEIAEGIIRSENR